VDAKSAISAAQTIMTGSGVGVGVCVGVCVRVGVNVTVGVIVLVGVFVFVGVALGKNNPGMLVFFCMALPCTTLTSMIKTDKTIINNLRIFSPMLQNCSSL
jgi:hypothetical protein